MLTAALRVYRWDRRTSSISSDRLEPAALPALERALAVYRSSIGGARGAVRNAARTALEGLRPDRVEPVVKLLDDTATYDWPRTARCAERRVLVFEAAASRHPVLEPEAAREILSGALGTAPQGLDAIVADLYADYPAFHRLVGFPADYAADALRADYDLAQAQALLYSATRVTVEARGEFKHILRYARLARLLYQLEPLSAPAPHRARRVHDKSRSPAIDSCSTGRARCSGKRVPMGWTSPGSWPPSSGSRPGASAPRSSCGEAGGRSSFG